MSLQNAFRERVPARTEPLGPPPAHKHRQLFDSPLPRNGFQPWIASIDNGLCDVSVARSGLGLIQHCFNDMVHPP